MDRKMILKALISAMLLMASFFCFAKPTAVAVMLDLSGSQASLGSEAMKGMLLAVSQLNPTESQRLLLSLNNSRSNDNIAHEIAKYLFKNVALAAGFTDNNAIIAVGPELVKSKIPLISIGATDPRLPAMFNNQVFLVPFGDNAQASAAAEFATKKFGKKVAILWDKSSDYTIELPQYFAARFKQLNGNILLNQSFSGCSINIKPHASKLKQVDFVYLAGLPNCIGQTILSLRQQGMDKPIIGGDGLDTPNLFQSDISNVWFTTHAWLSQQNKSKNIQRFLKAYKQFYGGMPQNAFAALGYDAVMIINLANKQAHPSQAITKALEKINNYIGISGTISYSPKHHVPIKTVWILEVANGKQQLATRFIPKKIPNANEVIQRFDLTGG